MKAKAWGGLIAGAAAGILAGAGYWLFRRPLAHRSGIIHFPEGIESPVEIIRDRWGVPHIYAQNAQDLLFAQGFVHAQDRLWQMDFQRRLVAGQLSEVLGAETIEVDRWMRIIGMHRVAEKEVPLLSEDETALLQAYTAGVNARIQAGRLPLEFALLRYRPRPWTLADSLSWSKMLSWTLSVNWESELIRARLIDRLGPERAAELEPPYPGDPSLIIPPGVDYSTLGTVAQDRATVSRPFVGPAAHQGLGSNNWVLAGERTTTGRPLLANDMHLLMSAPAIWYENHLHGGGWHVSGTTFPGIPGIVAGHNEHVAWGFTNGFADVQDLYLEKSRQSENGRLQFLTPEGWQDATLIPETIEVRGQEPVTETVIVSRHGPIINSLAPDLAGDQPLALRWTSLEPRPMFSALFGMNLAHDCGEFRQALNRWAAPVQNVVYADTAGDIAYTLAGLIPLRAGGDGRVPVPGWTDEYEWTGYIPFVELPHLWNPSQNYIVTANNRVADDHYPHWLSADYCQGDRAQRIVELLAATPQHSLESIQRMQQDQLSPTARAVAAILAQHKTADPELQTIIDLFKEWDGHLAAGSAAAAVYQVFMRQAIRVLLEEKLGDATLYYAGKGPTPLLMDRSILAHRSWEWLAQVLAEPDSHWFQTSQLQGRQAVLDHILQATRQSLIEKLGPDMADWRWDKLHQLTLAHTLGRATPLDKLFNRGPYPLGGDHNTVWASGANAFDLDSNNVVGPPFRLIADLSDWNQTLGVLAPGQSGQVGSPHYSDQVEDWLHGRYHPMPFDRPAVEKVARDRLWLRPAAGSPSDDGRDAETSE